MTHTAFTSSTSAAAMVAAFPRGPRIAFAPETGAGGGGSKPPAARKDAAEAEAQPDKLDRLMGMMEKLGDSHAALSDRLNALEKARAEPVPGPVPEGEDDEKPRAAADAVDQAVARYKADAGSREAMVKAQTRADAAFNLHGKRAPMPLHGETPIAYRVRMASEHKPYCKALHGVDLGAVAKADPKAFAVMEDQVYADSAAEADRPTMFDSPEPRRVVRRDPDSGRDIISYYGPHTYVKSLMPTAQRFAGFRVTPRAA